MYTGIDLMFYMNKLITYFNKPMKQEERWTCGPNSVVNAMKAKCRMRNIPYPLLTVDELIDTWQKTIKVGNKEQGFMLPLKSTIDSLAGKNIGELEIYNVFQGETDFSSIKKYVGRLVVPVIAVKFKTRSRHNGHMTYNVGSGNTNKFHILCVVDTEGDWIKCADSAYGNWSYISKDEIEVVVDCVYFNVKPFHADLIYPLEEIYTTQGFGENKDYYKQFGGYWEKIGHIGEDYRADIGTPVFAAHDGVISEQKDNKYSGNTIELSNKKNKTVYCHLDSFIYRVGENVKQGQVIAMSGNTGESTTGPHLHFELWKNGKPVDPTENIA